MILDDITFRKLVALALKQQTNKNNTDPLSQLERNPDFVANLPVVITEYDMVWIQNSSFCTPSQMIEIEVSGII